MVDINVESLAIAIGQVSAELIADWWDKRYPYRVRVDIDPGTPYSLGEGVEVSLSDSLLETGRVRSDLADIEVVYRGDADWEITTSSASVVEDEILVRFNTLYAFEDAISYYVYYGNPSLEGDPLSGAYIDSTYVNDIDPDSKYISYTNPDLDWTIDGSIVSTKVGAKISSQIYVERFKVIGTKRPDGGTVQFASGGVVLGEYDTYGQAVTASQTFYDLELSEPGLLDLTVEVLHARNPASTGNIIEIELISYDSYATLGIGDEELSPYLTWISNTGVKT